LTDSATYLSQLHQLLNQHFDLAEIRTLCLNLNVDYESIAGEEKPSRIRELLLGLGRNGRLPELITLAQQQRPLVEWPPLPDDFQLPESLADGRTAVPANQYHIYGDNKQGDKLTGDKIGRDKNVVGDVSGQSAVAVGERAQATINRYGDIIIHADNFEDLPPAPGEPPYKGLAYFSTKDKVIFFGREKLSDELADRLQTTSFLAIMGASGSGKSSLLRAGIIPRLEERNWRIHIIKPGTHPLAALAASLTRDELDPATTNTIGNALATNANTLHQTAEKLIARTHAERLLLAVDQFEELFTQCKDSQEQKAFVDNLVSAAQAQGAVTVLLSMRADFYGRISQFHNLPDLISQEQVYIKPMAEEDLVRAIAEPAKRGGWQFVEGLVEQFVADVGKEPGHLPLLSHALLATWEQRRGVVMTLGGYREAGGVKSAIAQTAEATYAALTASEQLIAKRIFLRLTELGKGTEDTRRRVNQVELGEDAAMQAVAQRLTAARLITTNQDGIDVAHEALIREWPRLREWLDADREGLIIHRRLTDAEQEWRSNRQEPSLLYSGFRLNEAEQWIKDNANVLNDLEQTFFTASIDERQKEIEEKEEQHRREQEALERAAKAETARAIEAEEKRKEVEAVANQLKEQVALTNTALNDSEFRFRLARSRQLASEAQLLISQYNNDDPELNLPLILAREAVLTTWTTDQYVSGEVDAIFCSIINQASSLRLSISPKPTLFWNAQTEETKIDPVLEKQGTLKIDGDQEEQAKTKKNKAKHKLPKRTPEHHTDKISSIAFHPNGMYLLSSSYDHTMRLWELETGNQIRQYHGHSFGVNSANFSPDGKYIISASYDRTVRIWDTESGEQVQLFTTHTADVDFACFSPNGKLALSVSYDHTVRLWETETGKEIQIFSGPINAYVGSLPPRAAAFSPDGTMIAVVGGKPFFSGYDSLEFTISHGFVHLWDVETGEALHQIRTHGMAISVAFHQIGHLIVGFSNATQLLDVSSGKVLRTYPNSRVAHSFTFSPDGMTVAICTKKHSRVTELYDVETGANQGTIPGHTAAFSPNGSAIVTALKNSLHYWEVERNQTTVAVELAKIPIEEMKQVVDGIAFTPDGQEIVTHIEGIAYLLVSGHSFHGDDSIDTIDIESKAINQSTKTLLPVEYQNMLEVAPKSYSNWELFLSGTSIELRDKETSKMVRILKGHKENVVAATVSPDGRMIASISENGVVRLWMAQIDDLLKLAKMLIQREPPNLTEKEMQRFGFD
jgi:WD40 repeat protein/energy-coupling factor transporter ATP-binding protein EcfA2